MAQQMNYDDLPKQDKELIAEFQKLLGEVDRVRRSLYHPKQKGCSCDESGLCSHHAQIKKRLELVSDTLTWAINDAGREG